ncbi:class I SAM-dependent methyltransferase [Metabacillus iocasae]|uniref:SAM-dependent methyltransferase n=1 Tax=Priestia iocasae TaxID=2291674 RepID=A0ABS2QRE5_9BACI|nr:class I SAM-dependent methyltransferase [Metabacillus iocasae]MBM7702014.1 SAM-dependent methyltransferase [Metabacillus iocasae]
MAFTYTDFLAVFGIGGAHPGGLYVTKWLLEEQQIKNDTSILDIGCGTGQTSSYIATEFNCKVTPCDQHPLMIQKANERFATLSLPLKALKENAESLSFPQHSFDFVLSESVSIFSNLDLSLKEYARVLKPTGTFLAIEMAKDELMSSKDCDTIKSFYGFPQLLTEKEWVKKLNEAGFQHVTVLSPPHLQIEEHEVEEGTEFHLSSDVPEELYDIFDQHEHYTMQFSRSLGYRIFCCKT